MRAHTTRIQHPVGGWQCTEDALVQVQEDDLFYIGTPCRECLRIEKLEREN